MADDAAVANEQKEPTPESKSPESPPGVTPHVKTPAIDELFTACKAGDKERVERVLQSHPQLHINFADSTGDTAIHAAVSSGHLDIVQLLHRQGAILNVANINGETAVHYAAKLGSVPMMTFLRDEQLDLNRRNEAGETAIHLATQHEHKLLVEFLRLSGVNVNIQNKKGLTALHIACQKKFVAIAQMLLHLGCRMDLADHMQEMAIHDACKEGLLPVVQTMCAYGCPVDVENKSGMSPLHLAAKSGNPEIVRCLLLSGADLDKRNKDGVTAEDIAVARGHTEISDMLNFLTSSIARDKREPFVQQLMPSMKPINKVIVKVLGSSGVGKSALIEALKCGYFRSLMRSLTGYGTLPPSKSMVIEGDGEVRVGKKSNGLPKDVPLTTYVRGIDVQNCVINDAGDVALWEFSSYESYYNAYSKFVGNPNTIYLVVVNTVDSPAMRRRQVLFWLNYIRARVTPSEPLGTGGLHQWAPQVALVATHADAANCPRDANGEYEWKKESTEKETNLMQELETKFLSHLVLVPRMFILNTQEPMGVEMKHLRVALAEMKKNISASLPQCMGILDSMVAELVPWNKSLGNFPVVSWQTFVEYVHTKVNLLCTEEHLKELVYQLHATGEIIPMTSSMSTDVKLVLNPHWVCAEILGPIAAFENSQKLPVTGRLTSEDLRTLYPAMDPKEVAKLLEIIGLCTVYTVNGDIQCDFSFLNAVDAPSSIWADDDTPLEDLSDTTTCGGLSISVPEDLVPQLIHIFPDIQQHFQRQLLLKRSGFRLEQWKFGLKVIHNKMAAVITMSHDEKSIGVYVRGPAARKDQLFFFQEDMCEVLYCGVEESCPGLYMERQPFSPHDLRQQVPAPAAYTTTELFNARLDNKVKVSRQNPKLEEKMIDIVAYGSSEILSNMTFGPDLHISYLPFYARCQLAYLLDESGQSKGDWEALSAKLDVPRDDVVKIKAGSGDPNRSLSKTDQLLGLWAYEVGSTMRVLRQRLIDINRVDAAEVVTRHAPIYSFAVTPSNHEPSLLSPSNGPVLPKPRESKS